MKPKKQEMKHPPTHYEYYGPPENDPRKKNRIFIKCKRLRDKKKIVNTFVALAIEKGAGTIQIKGPDHSTKEGHAELYSDAGVDDKTLKKHSGIRGFFSRRKTE